MKKGQLFIKPQFAFGFPFKNGRAKVTNKGEKKVVPNSKGEYHYWESDKWFYIVGQEHYSLNSVLWNGYQRKL